MAAPPARIVFDGPLPDEAATARLAEDVAAILAPGDLVALAGDLGAGKTSFARALIRALAGDAGLDVPSPTFPIRLDYALERLAVTHADLYRLADPGEAEEIGLAEALEQGALLVEWPERAPDLASGARLSVVLAFEGGGRRAVLSADPALAARLERSLAARRFLERSGWRGAARVPIKGDASGRAYERVAAGGRTAILMNAPARPEGPPLAGGRSYDAIAHRALDVEPFLAVDHALRQAGFHAPEIFASDVAEGFLLLEDLGASGILDAAGRPAIARYEAAIDCLLALHARTWEPEIRLSGGGRYRVPAYDRDALLVEISLFADWFVPAEAGWDAAERDAFLSAWAAVLGRLPPGETLVLRDFHSPNILWCAGEGLDRIGLIDFQDALIGHPAYDVASLAQDARVDIDAVREQALVARYVAGRRRADPGFDEDAFRAAYAVLGAQRTTKVLGAFARLARAEGKAGYERHSRRVAALLRRNLAHPVLSGLRRWYERLV
ncbi:tRNA (adenosine(37)-N6)-threonylcarbamoyltransferase complex ATPase subunit type 1 TsaE [Propylenella binzhouense]|uniref:tRNA threonylcarbamoyladenosine biosynthesis protein TsaE n=1 Tax=Propylenella binzhouense TaxID=2555902 RepID=A0A964T3M5_9HYPH|nr:tRNA (adenosine(37)-N6)-threonylcarbamoyltransferase complex ATPase subunit type 1 TsaE [Propylenella binzhouense]